MKRIKLTVMAAILLVLGLAAGIRAEMQAGISLNSGGLSNFYLAIGDYNRVPETEVIVIKQRGIPDEELPVVFFIAAKAGVSRDEIIRLRLKNYSWMSIVRKYRLNPAIFYIPVNVQIRKGPYGKAYGYYQRKPENKWKNINLSNQDIINCVNLRFVSEHYGYNPYEVIKMRESGRRFVDINDEVRKVKGKKYDKTWKKGHKKNKR